ncbi:cofilin [Sporobolomyces salmoneus]|uniref:cofilin n=1 Tax=Sporobolomyces salmoneus TaxID=183962 RepID=UPI00317D9BB9
MDGWTLGEGGATSSGVVVNDECLSAYNELKLGKKSKFIIFKLSDNLKEVVVDTVSESSDYEEFISGLPETGCRWAVYDFEYEKGSDGKRNKLCFYAWSPDNSKIKEKMVYASSKEALRRSLNGISTEIQGTDFTEVAYQAILDKVSRGSA